MRFCGTQIREIERETEEKVKSAQERLREEFESQVQWFISDRVPVVAETLARVMGVDEERGRGEGEGDRDSISDWRG